MCIGGKGYGAITLHWVQVLNPMSHLRELSQQICGENPTDFRLKYLKYDLFSKLYRLAGIRIGYIIYDPGYNLDLRYVRGLLVTLTLNFTFKW